MVREQSSELPRPDLMDAASVVGETDEVRVVEQHHVAVRGDLAVRLDVLRTGGMSGREGRGRVLPDAGVLALRGDETAMGEDSGVPRLREVRVRHAPGSVLVGPCPGFGVNALPIPFSASVSSLGMIQSLLDWPSLIFGSICRY